MALRVRSSDTTFHHSSSFIHDHLFGTLLLQLMGSQKQPCKAQFLFAIGKSALMLELSFLPDQYFLIEGFVYNGKNRQLLFWEENANLETLIFLAEIILQCPKIFIHYLAQPYKSLNGLLNIKLGKRMLPDPRRGD